MKRVMLFIGVLFSTYLFSQEQLNVGVDAGITVGNIEPISKMAFGADVNYLFDVSQDFVAGPSLGIIYFSPEDDIVDAPMFLPISAALSFHSIDERFYVGGELGYAISLSDFNDDGGFFIKPTIGYKLSDSLKINAFYAGIKTGSPTYAYAGIGLKYDFKAANYGQY